MRCIRDFAARADVQRMRVCGACGLRDPGDACEREVVLAELSSEHWLHVGNSILFHNWKIACLDAVDSRWTRWTRWTRWIHLVDEVDEVDILVGGSTYSHRWFHRIHPVDEVLYVSSTGGRSTLSA